MPSSGMPICDSACGDAKLPCKRVKAKSGVFHAENPANGVHCGGSVVGDGVRQNDGMGFSVWKVERSAERVTELVMHGHIDGAKADSREPGTVSASVRPSTLPGLIVIFGKASASARMDSCAINEMIGFRSRAYKASTERAMAFMPDTADRPGGNVMVRSTS